VTVPSLRSRKTDFLFFVIMRRAHSYPLCYLRGGCQSDERSGASPEFPIGQGGS